MSCFTSASRRSGARAGFVLRHRRPRTTKYRPSGVVGYSFRVMGEVALRGFFHSRARAWRARLRRTRWLGTRARVRPDRRRGARRRAVRGRFERSSVRRPQGRCVEGRRRSLLLPCRPLDAGTARAMINATPFPAPSIGRPMMLSPKAVGIAACAVTVLIRVGSVIVARLGAPDADVARHRLHALRRRSTHARALGSAHRLPLPRPRPPRRATTQGMAGRPPSRDAHGTAVGTVGQC